MKLLIGVPCFDMVHTDFHESVMNMEKPEGCYYTIVKNTLIYVARNIIAGNAYTNGFDRVLFLDSDMTFPKDMIARLSADMDKGYDLVTGLYFTRRPPIKPNIFEKMWYNSNTDAGAVQFTEYPEGLVDIEACGFGCCMVSIDLFKRVGEKFGSPFTPLDGVGEDLSFCWRAVQIGAKMCCDTTIKCNHIGQAVFNEEYYKLQGVAKHD